MSPELLYQIALSLVPNIGPVQAKILIEHYGRASSVFNARIDDLKHLEGIGEIRAKCIKSFSAFDIAEKEIRFIEKFGIKPLFLADAAYPQRLLNCYDSPLLLFYKGNANLNTSRVVAIVGTRHNTEYGKQATEKLVSELAGLDVLVISGLAFGIDAIAHKAALANSMETIGVLAHGLGQVYPSQHAAIAKEMTKAGGLITEFRSNTMPDKHNFPTRNRIVAGMSDAVIVIETRTKGGSIITAELANGYNRDVFAIPGKNTDIKSAGCNLLIRDNKAVLLSDTSFLLQTMGWTSQKNKPHKQRELFTDLSENERVVVNILAQKESVHIDEICFKAHINTSLVAAAILNLELQNIITALPGKMYSLQ